MNRGRSLAQRTLASEKVRFGLVGGVNTSVDFIVLFILTKFLGVPAVLANIVSTSGAVAVSYILNKKAVFGDTDRTNRKQVVLFVFITLAGLWGLQSLIIVSITTSFYGADNDGLVLLGAKLIATVASLIWNYLWYSRVVFRKKQ